jgi:nucleotide-binding universal stress UspA family protein
MTETGAPTRRVVVGVDGSASSINALRTAAAVATATGAELDAVTAWEYPASYGWVAGAVEWRPDSDATGILTTAIDEAFVESKPPGLRCIVREGHPAKILIEASADAELLVVGSRGHGGFVGLLLGSVSAYCAEHAACPVLVAREPDQVAGGASPANSVESAVPAS